MKKSLPLILALGVALTFAGCDLLGLTKKDTPFTAPTVADPSTLPATGASSNPAGQAEAVSLFSEAVTAFSDALSYETETSPSMRATETDTQTISWHESVGGGTVAIDGTMSYTVTMPDESWAPTANTTYNDLVKYLIAMDVAGTITNVTFPGDFSYTYTISGEMLSELDMNLNMDFHIGSDLVEFSDSTADMDLSYAHRFGSAYSVLRSDGLGAKFTISFAAQLSRNNVSMDVMSSLGESFESQLASQTATLNVYDDSNTLLGSYEVPLTELGIVSMRF